MRVLFVSNRRKVAKSSVWKRPDSLEGYQVLHPWIVSRAPNARDFLEAAEIADWRRRKMPPEVVQVVLADARPYGEIAAACNVGYQTVAAIKARRLYAHVPFAGEVPRGSRSALSAETVRAVYLDPATTREAAQRHGVSLSRARQIRQGRIGVDITHGLTSPSAARRALDARHARERDDLDARHARERADLGAA